MVALAKSRRDGRGASQHVRCVQVSEHWALAVDHPDVVEGICKKANIVTLLVIEFVTRSGSDGDQGVGRSLDPGHLVGRKLYHH
ncbi:MAG: hypothetical protein ABW128_18680 [Rhizorhabdus sp.]